MAGLTNKYNIYASTLDQADVNVMHERIDHGAILLKNHVFQFDFLNDDFTKLPQSLQDIINDEDKRKKLVIYINPPYAEVSSKAEKGKVGVNLTKTHSKYISLLGTAGRELFAQFLIRIYSELHGLILAEFSTLKLLQGSAFLNLKNNFHAKLEKAFLAPADTFDNVKGQFPIGFKIWNTKKKELFEIIAADVYDKNADFTGTKVITALDKSQYINKFISIYKTNNENSIGFMDGINGNDFQHNNIVYVLNTKEQLPNPRGIWINKGNLIPVSIYYSVRKAIKATWLNDRDQFLNPNDGWQNDLEFQSDCLAYTLFNNNIQSKYGANHWIPFTEQEVNAKEKFASNFMTDFIKGKIKAEQPTAINQNLFSIAVTPIPTLTSIPFPTLSGFETLKELNTVKELKTELDINTPTRSQVGSTFPNLDSNETLSGSETLKEFETLKELAFDPLQFSPEATAVFDTGRELWKYYHSQTVNSTNEVNVNVNASLYDIREYFQGRNDKGRMNARSTDEKYTQLISELRNKLNLLSNKIKPKIYEYEFLKE